MFLLFFFFGISLYTDHYLQLTRKNAKQGNLYPLKGLVKVFILSQNRFVSSLHLALNFEYLFWGKSKNKWMLRIRNVLLELLHVNRTTESFSPISFLLTQVNICSTYSFAVWVWAWRKQILPRASYEIVFGSSFK